jgi:hypothetical protein
VANVRDMDIPKPTVIIAPGVSNAQAIVALNIVHVKTNHNMSSASFAMATIQPNIKGASFKKKYKNEPFRL